MSKALFTSDDENFQLILKKTALNTGMWIQIRLDPHSFGSRGVK